MTDTTKPLFSKGDVVIHPKRPEWGEGIVDKTTTIQHKGKTAQRLVVKFAQHGRISINTGVATLESKGVNVEAGKPKPKPFNTRPALDLSDSRTTKSEPQQEVLPANPANEETGWLASIREKKTSEQLAELPEEFSDPFITTRNRLMNTIESFRFQPTPRGLLDWAIAQTRLEDPLTEYTRIELEQAFPRYTRNRDRHVVTLMRQMKAEGQWKEVEKIVKATKLPKAKSALQKAMKSI